MGDVGYVAVLPLHPGGDDDHEEHGDGTHRGYGGVAEQPTGNSDEPSDSCNE